LRASPPTQRTLRADVIVFSLAIHFLALALPLSLLQIYDRILPSQSFGTASFLVLGVGVAIILEAFLRYGRSTILASAGGRYEARTTLAVLERLEKADVQAVEARGPTAVADAFRAIGQVREFWSGPSGTAVYELPFAMVYIGLIGYLGGWLALIPLTLLLFAVVLVAAVNSAVRRTMERTEAVAQERQSFAWALFGALDYLKSIGAEEALATLWRRINRRFMAQTATLETRMGWIREGSATVGQLSTVLVVAFGAVSVIDGLMTTGTLAACTMLAGRSIGPAVGSLSHWSQIGRIRHAESKIRDVLSLPDAPASGSREQGAPSIARGEIRIEAPKFLEAPATVVPGELVQIDTDDISAASRLLTVVAGIGADPDVNVRIDGQDISTFDAARYRDDVILVSTHLALVPGSILNNLTLYDPRYNADVQPLCDALGLTDHFNRLKNGILTEVGPGNAETLDEGIYQRIAIARALVRRPKILLLDHAASGVDLDGLKRLARVLEGQRGQTTVLIASFKDPLVALCDRKITLAREEVRA
jgi:ATP-binding cassette subfamily C protein LapB